MSYNWQPDQSPSDSLPPQAPPIDYPASWQVPSQPPQRQRRKREGIVGVLAAIGAAILKFGVLILKLFKFTTFISIVLSYGAMALLFGWQFGAGILLLILVHEMGHMLFAKVEGLPVSAPIFLGPLGAVINIKKPFVDARQEAVIAIGGPVVGTLGSLLCYVIALQLHVGYLQGLFYALGSFGCFVNLFNLTPMVPLDGGRVAAALSRWFNVAGLVIMLGILLLTHNELLILFLILGGYTTYHRFRNKGFPTTPMGTRIWIGAAYLSMLALTAGGMIYGHDALVNGGYIS